MAQSLHDLGQQARSRLTRSGFDDTVQNSSGLLFTVPTTVGSGQEDTFSCYHVVTPMGTVSNQKFILKLMIPVGIRRGQSPPSRHSNLLGTLWCSFLLVL